MRQAADQSKQGKQHPHQEKRDILKFDFCEKAAFETVSHSQERTEKQQAELYLLRYELGEEAIRGKAEDDDPEH